MKFDFKITTWERVTVAPEHEEMVLEGIQDGSITSANGIFELVDAECKRLDDVDVQMTPEENGGEATIEVMSDEGECEYTNKPI